MLFLVLRQATDDQKYAFYRDDDVIDVEAAQERSEVEPDHAEVVQDRQEAHHEEDDAGDDEEPVQVVRWRFDETVNHDVQPCDRDNPDRHIRRQSAHERGEFPF